ncbi:MAG: septum formation initiator family protein [Flavobacteriia bacterium]|nr:septum formation initiator family protein [Flavobacteriia bacterium]
MTNIYVLLLTAFLIWMFFFDTNSLLIQSELQDQIKVLEAEKTFLEKAIKKDRALLNELSSKEALEKFARERYLLKKKNEDVFIIQYEDSVNLKTQ